TCRTAIVDAHAHLYDGGANRYGIFARKDPGFEAFVGDYSALPRTYLLDGYLSATSSRKVDGLIWHEFISEDPIKEVTWASNWPQLRKSRLRLLAWLTSAIQTCRSALISTARIRT